MSEPHPAIVRSEEQPEDVNTVDTPPQAGPETAPSEEDREVEREIARKTRRSLLTGGIAALAGFAGWEWLRTRRPDDEVQWPLRLALRANEQLTRDYFRDTRLAPTFSEADIEAPRRNGDYGLGDDVDPKWQLQVDGAGDDTLSLSLADIKSLPKIEMITEFKCIEGWSRILKWGGARFRDFAAKWGPKDLDAGSYVSLETPDAEYYVGLDAASAMHPQTLLAYELNGKPLPVENGAPLRLVIPLKYGVKNLKRIGRIEFTDRRPADYWAERGYDWYAGF
jgi:DMSO/TMAO reductase YedYZ molybdopterin-dependent catalytic subunit